jgi:hypothetical protein
VRHEDSLQEPATTPPIPRAFLYSYRSNEKIAPGSNADRHTTHNHIMHTVKENPPDKWQTIDLCASGAFQVLQPYLAGVVHDSTMSAAHAAAGEGDVIGAQRADRHDGLGILPQNFMR